MKETDRMNLIRAFRQEPPDDCVHDAVDTALKAWRQLIKEALDEPYKALLMARDPCLPRWLSGFAREIGTTDDGGYPLRPTLRRMVAEALDNPKLSRSILNILATSDDLDSRIRSLTPMFRILSGLPGSDTQ